MWNMIFTQSIYKLVVLLIIHFGSESIFSYHSDGEKAQLKTMVFNTFVWMQIFNQYKYATLLTAPQCHTDVSYNSDHRIDNKLNILEGITQNWIFRGINLSMIAGQVLIIMTGGRALQVVHLNSVQWGYSIVLGFLSIQSQ
jgi:P-type Ca2+ transporter type 2C